MPAALPPGKTYLLESICLQTNDANITVYYLSLCFHTWYRVLLMTVPSLKNSRHVTYLASFYTLLYSAFRKSLCTYEWYWMWCPRTFIQAWTHLILFAHTFCRSAFRKSLCTYKGCWKWCPWALIMTTKSTYNTLSAQQLPECTAVPLHH
jgi:hypothetical protein